MATTKKETPIEENPSNVYKRVRIGRPPLFERAEDMWKEALKYFAWCDAHPYLVNVKRKQKRSDRGDEQQQEQAPVARPYTLDGLCLWLNILIPWATFKANCKRRADAKDFDIVINACEAAVRGQQVNGAMIGVYSERLTARLNGITEKTQVEVDQKQTTLTWEQYRELLGGTE